MRATILHLGFLLVLAGALPAAWSAPPALSEPVSIQRAGIIYETRASDTLSAIAQRFTTRAENWVMLGKLNNIASDTKIPIGTRITIPADILLDEPSQATVAALSGSVSAVAANGKSLLLTLGATITEGMQIDTGNNSFLTLLLPDQSRISLPSNSRIKFAKLRMARYTNSPRTEILLLNGRVESKVAPLEQNKGLFEVHTPRSVAGVRGTNFRVSLNDNGAATEVLSGRVEVGRPSQRARLMLHAGQGNIINARSVGKAVDLLPTPQLAQLPERLGPAGAQFALTPIAGAAGYHIQVATDQNAHNILLEGRSNTTRVKLDGLPNGDYFARISAIDKLGLEGPASTHAFTLNAASRNLSKGAEQSAPYVDRSEKKQLALKWAALPGQKFSVQVARDAGFSWLLYTVKTEAPEARFPRPGFGTYYARVQAINPDGSSTAYSPAQPFVVTDQWIIHDGNPINAAR